MGADQIGYLWTQQAEYDAQKVRDIITDRVHSARREILHAAAALVRHEQQQGAEPALKDYPVLSRIGQDIDDDDIAYIIDNWHGRLEEQGLIDDLVSFVVSPSARDTCTRRDPSNP